MLSPKPHILYVDDDKDSCELAVVMFECANLDCVVTAAESAEEALSLVEAEPFDLYIFDCRLPEMSGVELCRCIRQFDSDTPVLFYTASAQHSERIKAMAAGASEYLVKPDDLEKLTATVRRLLNKNLTNFKNETSNKTKMYNGIY